MQRPIISIIIPSFNQGRFIEGTLASVFAQGYPALDVRIYDGGSTDETLEVLRRHANRIAHWESVPDRGQSHAINKGLAAMRGKIWMYLNSDDWLAPGALQAVAEAFADPQVAWVVGGGEIRNASGTCGSVVPGIPRSDYDVLTPWARPGRHVFPFSGASFHRAESVPRHGMFDEALHLCMDIEYYTRLHFAGITPQRLERTLACWRWHDEAKTSTIGADLGFRVEEIQIATRYAHHLASAERTRLMGEIRRWRDWLALRGRTTLAALLSAAIRRPHLLRFRPWWGAVRGTLR